MFCVIEGAVTLTDFRTVRSGDQEREGQHEDVSSQYTRRLQRRLQCMQEVAMLASFSVVPMGVGEGVASDGVKQIVAEALAIVDNSGLSYQLGPMHTVVEGPQEKVLEVILQCHRRVLELAPRVLTSITLDDRKGATDRLHGKVRDVEQILGKPLSRP